MEEELRNKSANEKSANVLVGIVTKIGRYIGRKIEIDR